MAGLQELFDRTGGPDPNTPALPVTEPTPSFLQAFSSATHTGANGAGPILNANAVLFPNRADNYRNNSTINDFKLGNGLGRSRAFRKPDSMGGMTKEGFNGAPIPNKNFGRSTTSSDLNWRRGDMMERAQMALKKMGHRPAEVPKGGESDIGVV